MATSKRSRKALESLATTAAPVAADVSAPAAALGATPTWNPPLLRKSSSTGLLNSGAGTPPDASPALPSGGAFPKLRRKSSSLQDVNDSTKQRRQTEKAKPKKSARQLNKRASGWSTPKSAAAPGSLPQLSSHASKSHHSLSAQSSATGQSKRSKRAGDIELTRQATIDVVLKYQLGQHELKKFKQCFTQIDLEYVLAIDFEEFVHAMLAVAFDTFDPAKTGSIGEKEFKRLISVVNDGQPVYPGNFKNALTEFDRNKDGLLDFEEFKIMNKRYPMLLFPCFRLQDRMQKSTLGEHHWLQLHRRLYQKLKLENYQRKNNGALPPLSVIGTIRRFFRLDAIDVYQP
ncbi:hypothetical protein PybrP1_003150 [[Pythium] brassicae (nom. inval.)]|nr:hypothetical protein PybrP1_003150 [[Pythium] brassicae (nom. inval.)]